MPRNPTTGVFTRVDNSFSEPAVNTVIDPVDATATFNDYDDGITGSARLDGANSFVGVQTIGPDDGFGEQANTNLKVNGSGMTLSSSTYATNPVFTMRSYSTQTDGGVSIYAQNLNSNGDIKNGAVLNFGLVNNAAGQEEGLFDFNVMRAGAEISLGSASFTTRATETGVNFGRFYFGAGQTPITASANAVLDDIWVQSATNQIQGVTNITTAGGFNKVKIEAGDYSGTVTITNAATVKIVGAPTISGGGSIINSYAWWVGSGTSRLDGALVITAGGFNLTGSMVLNGTGGANHVLKQTSLNGAVTSGQVSFSELSGTVTASQMPALTGDITTTAGTVATTLATVNSNVGSFGSATQVGTFTVNAKGLTTAASNVTITPAVGSITGLGTGVATALAVNVGSAGAPVVNGGALGTPSSGTLTSATGLPISTGVSGLGTGIATALAVNTGSAGAPVLFNGAGGTPSSITLTNASGTAASLTAGNATNTAITDDTSTNASMNLTWVTSNTGNLPQKTTSTKLTFNPSTGVLSSTSFTGAGTGLTGTAASLTAGTVTTNANLTGNVTSVGNATTLAAGSASVLNSGTLAAARGGAGTINGALKGNGSGVVSQAAFADISDYSTGTWTPVLTFGGGSTGITYGTQTGAYIKFGKMVFVTANIILTNKGSSTGSAAFSGLPATSSTKFGVLAVYLNAMNGSINAHWQVGIDASATTGFIQYLLNNNATNAADTNFTNTSSLFLSGCYESAS